MSLHSLFSKVSTFLVLSLYIIAIVLTFFLIVTVSSGAVMAEEIIWDDPDAPLPQQHPVTSESMLFPGSSLSDNRLTVTVNVVGDILGGFLYSTATGASDVSRNKLEISNVISGLDYFMGGFGLYMDVDGGVTSNDNVIAVQDSRATSITGGYARVLARPGAPDFAGSLATSSRNEVRLYNTSASGEVSGGYASLMWVKGSATANENKVYMENSQAGRVFGARAWPDDFGNDTAAEANFNQVYLKNVRISESVTGAGVLAYKSVQANYNTITLEGLVEVGQSIRGGMVLENYFAGEKDVFTGNVLNVIKPHESGIKAQMALENFEEYNFVFSSLAPSGSIGLKVNGQITLNDGVDRGSVLKSFTLLNEGAVPKENTRYILMTSDTDIDYTGFTKPADYTEIFEPLLNYDVAFSQTPRQLTATVRNFRASDDTEIIPGGPSGGLDIINDGGDLISGPGVDPADPFGPDDGYDPLDDFGSGGGYDPLDDFGPGDGYDPLDDFGPDDGYDPLDDYGADDGYDSSTGGTGSGNDGSGSANDGYEDGYEGRDKPYPERNQEVKGQNREQDRNQVRRQGRRKNRKAEARAKKLNPCPRVFFKSKGGRTRRHDSYDLKINSFSALLGADCGRYLSGGLLTFGAAFEGGWGSYDSFRHYASGQVAGTGDLNYAGGAILGRFDFNPEKYGRLYLESAVRTGKLDTDFKSRDLSGFGGREVSYTTGNAYLGFQFGVGDYIPLDQVSYLNIYGQYFWTRLEGERIKLSSGQSVEMEDIDSSRIRTGLQYHRALNKNLRTFVGGAFEYETEGRVEAKVNGFKVPPTSKKGGTGIFEAGITYSTRSAKPFTAGLAAQAYAGRRRGGAGVLQLGVLF
ncbi:MAG: autotransporter outer membrane beta-barrel domain-containing protein [Deltaproteobacteria bacterium]|nr:autotransporter outer membrane beta-barrel domain-containing protein [Deltaproteobacteria bacterium]